MGRDKRGVLWTLGIPDLRRIWVAQVLSEFGDWAARIALAILIFDRTKSPALTGLVTAASLIPWIGPGQLLATLGDRYPRRAVMISSDLVRAALFLLIAMPLPVWAILMAAFVAGLATPPFETARSALMAEVVPRKQYGDAVTLTQITYQFVLLAGYAAGGGLVAVVGAQGALIVNGSSFALSALTLTLLEGGRTPKEREAASKKMKEAARVLTTDLIVRRAVLLSTIPLSLAFIAEALVAVYVKDQLGAGNAVVGLLAATVPAGTIFGGLLVPRSGDHRLLLRWAAGTGLVASVAGAIGFSLRPSLPLAMFPFFSAGVVFAMVIPANTVAGLRIPDRVRSSAFGLISGFVTGSQGLAAFLGGTLAAYLGMARASALALAVSAALCLVALIYVPEMRRGGEEPMGAEERREKLLSAASER